MLAHSFSTKYAHRHWYGFVDYNFTRAATTLCDINSDNEVMRGHNENISCISNGCGNRQAYKWISSQKLDIISSVWRENTFVTN